MTIKTVPPWKAKGTAAEVSPWKASTVWNLLKPKEVKAEGDDVAEAEGPDAVMEAKYERATQMPQ